MSCSFALEHYRELLDAARAGGYRFGRFEGEPEAGRVYLRHDVDLSLDAALQMAELEAQGYSAAVSSILDEYMSAPVDGFLNVMAEPWFAQGMYRSDSNQHWRSGCPHEELPRGELEWLQLLTHPEIWVYAGETMGTTMRSMLDAERDRRLQQLAEDRIDLA